MYIVPLKTAVVQAVRATFTDVYPEPDFAGLRPDGTPKIWCSIEYPVAQANYPGIWVNYEDTEELAIAGIGHTEYVLDDQGVEREVTRSRFGGVITMTCVALTSLERDRLYDELVRTVIFARKDASVSAFRDRIEQNDLIAMNADFDKVQPGGDTAAPGTPWGTEEMIYERSISINVIGEFVSNVDLGTLIKLSTIIVRGYADGTPEPGFIGPPSESLNAGLLGSHPEGFTATVPADGWL